MLTQLRTDAKRLVAVLLASVLTVGVVVGVAAPAQAHDGTQILIFTKTTQYRHTDAIDKGTPSSPPRSRPRAWR